MSDSKKGRSKPAVRGSGRGRDPYPATSSSAREAKVGEGDGAVRLNKYLADHGVASRRACDELILAGKVTVDGDPVTELGTKIVPQDQRVEIDGFILRPEKAQRRYFLLNKPAGVVCTSERRETRPRAIDLITAREKGRIYTVGRLDEESKGLILLTNDGEFAQRIAHPKFGVPKTYRVKVRGRISEEAVQKVREGVHLSEGRTAGARIVVQRRGHEYSTLDVTLLEGMNREIRRAFARVGSKVVDLKRTTIGPLTSRGLKVGHWRPLTRNEVEALLGKESGIEHPEPKSDGRRDGAGDEGRGRAGRKLGQGRAGGYGRGRAGGGPGRGRPTPGRKRLGRGR